MHFSRSGLSLALKLPEQVPVAFLEQRSLFSVGEARLKSTIFLIRPVLQLKIILSVAIPVNEHLVVANPKFPNVDVF